jgi:hypothetical protein
LGVAIVEDEVGVGVGVGVVKLELQLRGEIRNGCRHHWGTNL